MGSPSNSPIVQIVRDRTAIRGFTYNVIFPINSLDAFTFTSKHAGQINAVTGMNIASYTLKKNGSATGVPFTVVEGDTITLESVVKINSGAAAEFIITAPQHAQENIVLNTLTEVDATRKHLFVICYNSQTISVIDTDTDTEESIITLPAGHSFQCLAYRSADDFIYVFGLNRVCKIDANPASGNFKNVYALDGTLNGSTSLSSGSAYPVGACSYDYISDQIYLAEHIYDYFGKWNFSASSWNPQVYPGNAGGNPFFIPNNKIVIGAQHMLYTEADLPKSFGPSDGNIVSLTCKPAYNSKNNSFYVGLANVKRYNADNGQLISTINSSGAASNAVYQSLGNVVYCPDYDILVALQYGRQISDYKNYVVDTLTNTTIGNYDRQNREANEVTARSAVYGAKSKKFYHMVNGESAAVYRLHKYDPQIWVDNGKVDLTDMIDGYITLTNDMSQPATSGYGFRGGNAACFNHLIPY